ncbi:MAG: hypothetical protein EXS31_12705 [Pedosphaera sp.]|nr:hypothetical protein [Pedosphaera sp.]
MMSNQKGIQGVGMDQDTFTKLVQVEHHLHEDASEVAGGLVVPLLLLGVLFGLFLALWIFSGGLSRCAFPTGDARRKVVRS